jgi:hypothetical protein
MDETLDIKSRGRAPRLTKLQKYELPMSGQETIRVYAHPGARTISLQMRFTESYGHSSLTFAEARALSALLDRALAVARIRLPRYPEPKTRHPHSPGSQPLEDQARQAPSTTSPPE